MPPVLSCSICSSKYDQLLHKPLILLCGHSTCFSCFYRNWEVSEDVVMNKQQEAAHFQRCPQCRQEYSWDGCFIDKFLIVNTEHINDELLQMAITTKKMAAERNKARWRLLELRGKKEAVKGRHQQELEEVETRQLLVPKCSMCEAVDSATSQLRICLRCSTEDGHNVSKTLIKDAQKANKHLICDFCSITVPCPKTLGRRPHHAILWKEVQRCHEFEEKLHALLHGNRVQFNRNARNKVEELKKRYKVEEDDEMRKEILRELEEVVIEIN